MSYDFALLCCQCQRDCAICGRSGARLQLARPFGADLQITELEVVCQSHLPAAFILLPPTVRALAMGDLWSQVDQRQGRHAEDRRPVVRTPLYELAPQHEDLEAVTWLVGSFVSLVGLLGAAYRCVAAR